VQRSILDGLGEIQGKSKGKVVPVL